MPVYNGEKFIHETLDSFLTQTFNEFELIISDNKSTDNTESICREYAARDPRIRYIRQIENIGMMANFKFVLDEAVGDYFMWTAADDCITPVSALVDLLHPLNTGHNYYTFPEVDIINENREILQSNVMRIFEGRKTSYEHLIASIYLNNYQLYGLYNVVFLRNHYKFLDHCSSMNCYLESVFVHAISATAKGVYVPSAKRLYRRHSSNASSVISASKLLPDFVRYSTRSIALFLSMTSLRLSEKTKIIGLLLFRHSRVIIYLCLASAKQFLVKRL